MAVRKRKPITSTQRFQSYLISKDITKKSPEKPLTVGLKRTGGRNAYGRITMRHIGGGAKRKYRIIDFKRSVRNVWGTITSIEYDPNRNVRIGLVVYENGSKTYMLLPEGLGVGSRVYAGTDVDPTTGVSMPLQYIPVGFMVHNIEIRPGSGGVIARSAGSAAQFIGKSGEYATLKLPSNEVRMVRLDCWATIGTLGNAAFKNIVIGKAGRSRWRGVRPSVRGMAMNPVDHPHGGGEGRSKSGRLPVSPWGKDSKGTKTRSSKKRSTLIIRRRKG